VDVAVAEGRVCVFVADTTLRSVLVFDADEHFVEELSPPGTAARGFRPCAVLVHGTILYVANVGDRRIERWDMTRREWLTPFAPPDTQPRLIAPTGLCATGDAVLLIADAVQGRVYRVTTKGRWLTPIGRPGRGEGEFVRPKQVCCTPAGSIFVSDAGRQSVLVFDSTGQYRAEIHERADRWKGWTLPMGLIAMSPSDLSPLRRDGGNGPAPAPDAYVVVSDSLGGPPLTLLGIVVRAEEEASTDAN
jgi:DNA-binding beta-propeller fold protein YncE